MPMTWRSITFFKILMDHNYEKLILIGKHIFCFTSNCEHLLDEISIFYGFSPHVDASLGALYWWWTCVTLPSLFWDFQSFSIAFMVDSSHIFFFSLRRWWRTTTTLLVPHESNIICDWFSFREFSIIQILFIESIV